MSVSWLVDEDQVVNVVRLAEAAGFGVSVAPTVQLVDAFER